MAYIGYNPSQLAVAPFAVKSFTGDGSTTTFTLDQSVPGANEANVEVFVENVQQSPIDAYTIGGALNNSLIFSEAPVTGAVIYVIHKGESTYNLQPSTGSVTAATLDPVLRNFTVDNFTGNGSATTFTLTDTPYSANSILVTVDGIVQTASTNYTVSGTTLSFGSSAPDSGAVITVVHMGFSSGNKAVMDGSITALKLSTGGIRWDTSYNAYVGNNATNESATGIQGNLILGGPSGRRLGFAATSDTHYVKYKSTTIDGLDINGYSGLVFSTGSTSNSTWAERMRLDGSGNLGIGTTAPGSKLDVLRSSTSTATFDEAIIRAINTGTATLNQRVDIGMRFQDGTYNGIGGISMIRESATARSGTLQFAPIASDGNPTNAMRLDSNGLLTLPFGQIKFPATQNASSDANTLDDYEEGTWTPAPNFSTTNAFLSGTASGTYTKVGRFVSATFILSFDKQTSSGNFKVTGLPFVNINSVAGRSGAAISYVQRIGATSKVVTAWVAENTSSITFYFVSQSSSGLITDVTAADIDANTATMSMTINYQTT